MQLQPLRQFSLPDIANHLVHFTGRDGGSPAGAVPDAISHLADWDRLARVLADQRINAYPVFGTSQPVVCFSESTLPAICALIGDGRYSPCGIGFAKDVVFAAGGGPCFYVRGDLWPQVTMVPAALRPFCTRYWPGATPTDGEAELAAHLASESQWPHEREWRVIGTGDPSGFRFTWDQIRFLITPDARWKRFIAQWVASWAGEEYGAAVMDVPSVVLDSDGKVVEDQVGLFAH